MSEPEQLPIAVWVDNEMAKEGKLGPIFSYRLRKTGSLPFLIRRFARNDDAIEFIMKNQAAIFMLIQDSHRQPGRILEAWKNLRKAPAPSIGTCSGDFSLYVADAFIPTASQVFAGHSFYGTELQLLNEWAQLDPRIVTADKFELLRLTDLDVWNQQLSRWREAGRSLSPEILTLRPVAEEMTVLCGVHSHLIDDLSPREFEEVIAAIFKNHGFDVELTARTRDGGYDLVAVSNRKLIPETILVEVKHFAPHRPVGVGIVRQLYGVKHLRAASKAILVTSSYVSRDAQREFARVIPWELELKDRTDVINWCAKYANDLVADRPWRFGIKS